MPHKFLLIGKSGLLGSSFAKALNHKELVALDSSQLDITNWENVVRVVHEVKPDVIINCAGYNQVDAAEAVLELGKCNAVNVLGPENLAKAAQANDAILVQFSSDYVFDGRNVEGYNEESTQFGPESNYAKSKLAGEKAVIANANKFYIIRLSWLFGLGGQNFVTTMLKIVDEKANLTVVDDQFCKPTFTVDAVAATLGLIADGAEFGNYHLVNEGVTSWYDFAKKIFALSAKNASVSAVSSDKFQRPAKRPTNSALLNTKRPTLRHWESALAEYLNSLS